MVSCCPPRSDLLLPLEPIRDLWSTLFVLILVYFLFVFLRTSILPVLFVFDLSGYHSGTLGTHAGEKTVFSLKLLSYLASGAEAQIFRLTTRNPGSQEKWGHWGLFPGLRHPSRRRTFPNFKRDSSRKQIRTPVQLTPCSRKEDNHGQLLSMDFSGEAHRLPCGRSDGNPFVSVFPPFSPTFISNLKTLQESFSARTLLNE